jgi:simple sugar transport system ATP-binding protein
VVLVTHKLGEVARVADAATVLRNGSVAGGGRLSEVPVPRLLSLMLGKDPADLDADTAGALGLEPAAIAGNVRAASSEGLSEGAGTALSARNVHPAASEGPGTALSARNVLCVRGLTVRGPDGTSALAAADLDLRAGEITGIAGVEGNGQSELVRVLSGALRPTEGTVLLADTDITTAAPAARTRRGLGVVPEDRHHEGIVGALSVAENLFLADLDRFRRRGLLQRKAMDAAAAAVIAEYRIRTDGPRAEMRSLSGGNQQKVVLARELAIDGLRVLVAAQPTRGLDVGAVAAVLARLREAADRGVAVLVVSSEVPELLALCDRILVGYRGRLLGPVDAREPTAAAEIGALMTGTAA